MATKEIVFTQRGARDLQAMFRSMRQEAEQMGRAFGKVEKSSGRAARDTTRAWSAAKRPLNETERLAMKVARAQERAAKQAATAQARSAKHAADSRIKEATRASRAEQRLRDRALRAELNDWKARQRIETRHRHRMERMAFTHQRRRARIMRGQRSLFFDYTMGAYRRGGGMLRGAAGMLGMGGLAAIAGTGAYAIGSAAREGLALNDAARRLSRKGGGAVSADELRRGVEQTTLQVKGVKAMDVMAGMERFVSKTGDVGAAQRFGRTFAEIGLATGTDIEAIGAAAADLFEKFDIKTVEDMSKAMSVLAVQGKRGAFELEDAAAQFPKVAAAAQRFGVSGTKGLATLGGLTQIARRATPSGEEAATSVENMFKQLVAKADVIKAKTGTSVFRDKGKTQTNNIVDILAGTVAGAKGNQQLLQKIFDVRGIRAVSPLISTYNVAYQGAKGTEAERRAEAEKALRREIEKAIDATGALEEIQRDLADAQQDSSARMTAAWERFKIQISEKAVPGLIAGLENLATFVEQTDFSGVGAAIAAMATAARVAAETFGLILPKSQRSKLGEAQGKELEAKGKVMGLKGQRAQITAEIAGRTYFEKGKLVPGEATPQEQATLTTIDEAIKREEGVATTAGESAARARRFKNVPVAHPITGMTPGEIGAVLDPAGEALKKRTVAEAGGIGDIASMLERALAQQFPKLEGVKDVPLDTFAEAVRQATATLHELSRASAIQVK